MTNNRIRLSGATMLVLAVLSACSSAHSASAAHGNAAPSKSATSASQAFQDDGGASTARDVQVDRCFLNQSDAALPVAELDVHVTNHTGHKAQFMVEVDFYADNVLVGHDVIPTSDVDPGQSVAGAVTNHQPTHGKVTCSIVGTTAI